MKTIAIDFDGVIHAYSKGWYDGTIYDDPIPGVREALEKLSKRFRIIIYSTRNYKRVIRGRIQVNQVAEMEQWLSKHSIPYDTIHTKPGKPICKLFIDDHAYRFEGNWDKALSQIENLVMPGIEGQCDWRLNMISKEVLQSFISDADMDGLEYAASRVGHTGDREFDGLVNNIKLASLAHDDMEDYIEELEQKYGI